ncbi:MAG: hypothetical protein NC548_46690 [Lachnospiraceae bacterium]|nr:hypothetical protein [Lachnospiraceae bacterium]
MLAILPFGIDSLAYCFILLEGTYKRENAINSFADLDFYNIFGRATRIVSSDEASYFCIFYFENFLFHNSKSIEFNFKRIAVIITAVRGPYNAVIIFAIEDIDKIIVFSEFFGSIESGAFE